MRETRLSHDILEHPTPWIKYTLTPNFLVRLEAVKQIKAQKHHLGGELNPVLQSSFSAPQVVTQPRDDLSGMQPAADIFSVSDASMPFADGGQNATTPSSLMAELTSWGEFDSLVSYRA